MTWSGSSTGAAGKIGGGGGGGAEGPRTGRARRTGTSPTVGVSEGSGEAAGRFSGRGVALTFALFFAFDVAGFPGIGLCFTLAVFFGETVGSGVSLGRAFGFGVGEVCFFFFCFVAFAFGVGLGDSSGEADATARAFRNWARFSFSSSVSCARRSDPTMPLSASKVASQRRKRSTGAERNRARRAINPEAFRGQLVPPVAGLSESSSLHCRGRFGQGRRAFPFTTKDCI